MKLNAKIRLFRFKYYFYVGIFISFFAIIFLILQFFSNYDHHVNDVNRLKAPFNKVETFLIIAILSGVSNEAKRLVLRNSWLNLLKGNAEISYLFVVGGKGITSNQKNAIIKENETFKDILFLPHIEDAYEFLTSKVLNSFLYLNEHLEFRYLLKCDDDSFVRPAEVLTELKNNLNIANLYWGFFDGAARVKRRGKWKEENWMLCDNYLPYALGGGYVLAKHLVELIVNNAAYLKLYKTEDVSVGTWLAPFDVVRRHDPRFDTEYKSRGCSNTYLVTHKKNESEMYAYYSQLRKTNTLCKKEYKRELSYIYDWNVPPSKCCKRFNISIP